MTLRQDVDIVIEQVKMSFKNNKFQMWQTRKNGDFMRKLGWTYTQIQSYICNNLCYDNYYRGPSANFSSTGNKGAIIWEFGMEVEIYEVYVKVSILEENGEFRAACLSFHECERPIVYPLRKGSGIND
ncbi:TPA: hypothetical protein LWH17_002667 [Listeria innocua]|uniref:hypothetical protein n=1 Tax=Listeria monocytogenes TaxID=1639 RepID=UPI0010F353A6|nr:hypothetical protein [Listeria monocytogenes]EKY4027641.1 hypothetical protein [Listeria innocua]EAE1302396.1 hypothetical protein [Listeria monocytogenes]EJG4560629.1 hypothetical protein [Listeria monocytogenes]EJG4572681.1 hypothetical protein [Listeria monocytogenes]EJI3954732.1 hypothetical protein [Listeria monocytogenes]